MPFMVVCADCNSKIKIPDNFPESKTTAKCPKCTAIIAIPKDRGQSSANPSPSPIPSPSKAMPAAAAEYGAPQKPQPKEKFPVKGFGDFKSPDSPLFELDNWTLRTQATIFAVQKRYHFLHPETGEIVASLRQRSPWYTTLFGGFPAFRESVPRRYEVRDANGTLLFTLHQTGAKFNIKLLFSKWVDKTLAVSDGEGNPMWSIDFNTSTILQSIALKDPQANSAWTLGATSSGVTIPGTKIAKCYGMTLAGSDGSGIGYITDTDLLKDLEKMKEIHKTGKPVAEFSFLPRLPDLVLNVSPEAANSRQAKMMILAAAALVRVAQFRGTMFRTSQKKPF